MVSGNTKIQWTLSAKEDLKDILKYYKKHSAQGYILVKNALLNTVVIASKNPKIFKADRLKKDNDGTIRVFTIYHTRVVYQIMQGGIIVLRLRHTSREPEEY
jgi:plasmid stabilization system protein ParE